MLDSRQSTSIFQRAIADYHATGLLEPGEVNPYPSGSLESLLYRKAWIDSVQWHLEDEVRDPAVGAERGWALKKRIDACNQRRTDTVEALDNYLADQLSNQGIERRNDAVMNTETPGWVLDRMSILHLRIWHMREESERSEAGEAHVRKCAEKLGLLLEQAGDLGTAFDQLIGDLHSGRKYMKAYRPMKMYNDDSLNPVLYRRKSP